MSDSDESFVQRWSRLKQRAREEKPVAEAPPPDLPATAGAADAPLPEAGDAKEKEEKPFDPASLPPVESLTNESDYSGFMRPEVPEDLRQQALRRLWAADPVLSAPDLLDMHNIDYNAVPTFPDGVKTLYRIGQGMLEPEPEKAAEETASRQAAEAAAAGQSDDEKSPPDAAAQHADSTKMKDSGPNKT